MEFFTLIFCHSEGSFATEESLRWGRSFAFAQDDSEGTFRMTVGTVRDNW